MRGAPSPTSASASSSSSPPPAAPQAAQQFIKGRGGTLRTEIGQGARRGEIGVGCCAPPSTPSPPNARRG